MSCVFFGTLQMTRDLCMFLFFSLCRWHGSLRFLGMSDNSRVIAYYATFASSSQSAFCSMDLLFGTETLQFLRWIRDSWDPLLFAVPDWNVAESEIFGFRPRFLVLTAISFSYLTRKVWNCMCVTGCNIVTNRCCFYTPRNALKSCWPGYLSCLGAIFSKKRNSFTLLYSVYVLLNGSSICSGAQSLNFLCLIHDHAICNIDYITKDNKRTHWNCASRNAATSTVAHTVPTGSSRLRVGGSHFLFGFKRRVRG